MRGHKKMNYSLQMCSSTPQISSISQLSSRKSPALLKKKHDHCQETHSSCDHNKHTQAKPSPEVQLMPILAQISLSTLVLFLSSASSGQSMPTQRSFTEKLSLQRLETFYLGQLFPQGHRSKYHKDFFFPSIAIWPKLAQSSVWI